MDVRAGTMDNDASDSRILSINFGTSSIKFGVYDVVPG